MSKNNEDQNLFNQMNLGGFGGLRRKAQVENNSETPFEKALTRMGKTLDEILRVGNLSILNKLEKNILINSVNQVYVPLSNLVAKLKINEVCDFDIDANTILEEINKTNNLHKSELPEIGSNIVALASVVLAGVDLKGLEKEIVAKVLQLAKSLNNIVVDHFNKELKQENSDDNKQQNNEQPEQKEISTKDEAIRLLNWAEKYSESFYDSHNPTLAVQCVAGAIELALSTISKYKFNFDYYIEDVGIHEKFLKSYKQEIMRTVDFLNIYGGNSQALFQIAMQNEKNSLVSKLLKNERIFKLVHSAEEFDSNDYDNIIRMGGMYARYRIITMLLAYEQKFAKKHLELFMDIFNPDNSGNPKNNQVIAEHGEHFKNIGLSFGKLMELDIETANKKHVPLDFSLHVMMFMKDKFKALLVKYGKEPSRYKGEGAEIVTTDWFNLLAEKDHKQQLFEPIYDYNGETEYSFISPISLMDWKEPNIFYGMEVINNNKNLFGGEPKGNVFARALMPDFE